MEKLKNKILKNLRMQGKNQSYISDLLKLSQPTVSQKINGHIKWNDWELDELKTEKLI